MPALPPPYKFKTRPYKCRGTCRERDSATPEEREAQHVALTPLGDICSICHGPVKDAKDE